MATLTHTIDRFEGITLNLRLTRKFHLRIWLAVILIRLATKIIGFGLDIEREDA